MSRPAGPIYASTLHRRDRTWRARRRGAIGARLAIAGVTLAGVAALVAQHAG